MYASTTAMLALAAAASASFVTVKNNCGSSIYLTSTNSAQSTTGPAELPAGGTYVAQIVGQGNSLGLTKSTDYYSPNTPKLILGTSTASGTLYWSVSSVNGNPFDTQGFSITSPSGSNAEACGSATSPDGQTRGCPDNNVGLTVLTCTKSQ